MPLVSWAQAREDIYLLRALRDVRHDVDNAFYIDIGANDPEADSVTKLFYDCGWHGINVEPSPHWFHRIVAQRPRDINIQAAVSDIPGDLTFYNDSRGGLGTLVEDIAQSHRDHHHLSMEALTVPSVTLTALCEKYAPKDIHFLKIDVEGAEGAVLRSMDFTRFRPWVMCVESHIPLRTDLQTHGEWEQLVLDAGYRFVFTDLINRFYLAEEKSDRANAFAIPVDEFMLASDFLRIKELENGQANIAPPQSELGVKLDRLGEQIVNLATDRKKEFDTLREMIGAIKFDRKANIARQISEEVGFKGIQKNGLYRAFLGSEEPLSKVPQPLGLTSSLCHQAHFGYDQYRFWVKALKDRPLFFRKQWEFVYIAQVLFERGFLDKGKRGIVFGAGQEPLPALFASFGVEIVATDQSPEAAIDGGWVKSNQHTPDVSVLNSRGICTDQMFRNLVSFLNVDMNDVPNSLDGQFDFCWSACSLEHLGSLKHGLDFMDNAMRVLKPGGVAVHTTEFNISSNENTYESPDLSIYRRRDIESFSDAMKARGYIVSPVDWTLGEGFAEIVVDLPPYGRGEPHIRLSYANYDVTSIGMIIEKPFED